MQSHSTAENLFLEAASGVKYAYRRFGNAKCTPPDRPADELRDELPNYDS
jgi:hypothetical protein